MTQAMVTNVVPENELRIAQLRALKLFSDTIEKTYGPMGGLTVYSKQNVDRKTLAISKYTKDGATVIKNIEIDKPIETLIKDEIIDICTNVIKTIGDGTSTAVMLSYLVFKGLIELQSKGYSKRMIISVFQDVIKDTIKLIETNGKPCTLEDIGHIATTSLDGNEEMAKILEQVYSDYGMGAFIDVQASYTQETIIKGYDGMTYNSGYLEACFINNEYNHTCELNNPHIYVFESPIDTPEMIRIFDLIVKKEITEPTQKALKAQEKQKKITEFPYPTLIICPFIGRDANSYLDSMIKYFEQTPVNARQHFCVVSNMNTDPNYLIDIMKMTGAKFIKKYIDPEQYKADQIQGLAPTEINIKTFAGSAEKVIVDALTMKIINPQEMRDENNKLTSFFTNYVGELEDTLAKYEKTKEDIIKIGSLKKRIHTLKGNMVDLYVGGIGSSDQNVLIDAFEDAVLNCRSAAMDGVGRGANYEGLTTFYQMYSKVKGNSNDESLTIRDKLENEIIQLMFNSYLELVTKIYYLAEDTIDFEKTKASIMTSLKEEKFTPVNVITGKLDNTVLSSIKTEPAILASIAKIITTIFNTNQFLVPDPRFNVYTFGKEELNEKPDMVIDNRIKNY